MARPYDDRRWIQNPDGSFSRRLEEVPAEAPAQEQADDVSTTGAAADLAAELGVDLASVKGTGKNGKITKADVEKAANG